MIEDTLLTSSMSSPGMIGDGPVYKLRVPKQPLRSAKRSDTMAVELINSPGFPCYD
jgi:hypothetical protein